MSRAKKKRINAMHRKQRKRIRRVLLGPAMFSFASVLCFAMVQQSVHEAFPGVYE